MIKRVGVGVTTGGAGVVLGQLRSEEGRTALDTLYTTRGGCNCFATGDEGGTALTSKGALF